MSYSLPGGLFMYLPKVQVVKNLTKDKLSYKETFVDAQMNSYTIKTTWGRN